jgi:hypothetical protein
MAVRHALNLSLSDATTADGTRDLLFHLCIYMNCPRAGRGPQLAMISLLQCGHMPVAHLQMYPLHGSYGCDHCFQNMGALCDTISAASYTTSLLAPRLATDLRRIYTSYVATPFAQMVHP